MKKNQHQRRVGAIGRLESQLETSQKRTKDGSLVSLTEGDKNRITKELATIKSRV